MSDSSPSSAAIAPWSCGDGTIRVTPQGQPSVFDMIKVLGGQKNPHQVWARIVKDDQAVLSKCEDWKFPGARQRETPVTKDKESAYYILGLLPGAVGRKYREDAAKLFVAFLDSPAELAAGIADRLEPAKQEWLEARLNSKRTRSTFADCLKEHGVQGPGYGRCTNAVYIPVLGSDAKGMQEAVSQEKGLPLARVNPRDHMDIQQLRDLEFAERVAAGQLKRSSAHGNSQSERVVRTSAEYTKKLLDGDITIPGL